MFTSACEREATSRNFRWYARIKQIASESVFRHSCGVEIHQATEIIRKLADGVDPVTGERFPSDSAYQNADTVRALHLALEGLDRMKRHKDRVHSGPPNAGRPWTKDEETRMLQQFDAKIDVKLIAKEMNRTAGAIWARLEKVGRIQRKDYPGSTPFPPPRSGATSEPTEPATKETPADCPF